jgi:hypothetical protein
MGYSDLILFWLGFLAGCWAYRKGWDYFKDRIAEGITRLRKPRGE